MADNIFADLSPQTGAAPVLYGDPKKREVKTTTIGDTFGTVDDQGNFHPTYTKPPKAGEGDDPQKAALSSAIKDLGLDELLTGVTRARTAVQSGKATGITGAVMGMIPGTTAADFRSEGGYLDQIQGGVIMEKLQALKEASKTGASGMGALSEREGQRMAASVAALGPNMSDEALLNSLNDIERHAKTLKAVADGMDPRDPAVQQKYGIPKLDADIWGTGAGQPPAGGTPPPSAPPPRENTARAAQPEADAGMAELNAEQKAAYEAFWKANPKPTPQALSTFFDTIGVPGVGESDAANIIKGVEQGLGYSTAIDRTRVLRAELAKQDAIRGGGTLAESNAETLTKQGQTLGLSDEAAGVGRGLSKALQLENPIEGYRLGRDAERLRIDDARRQLGYSGTALEVAGSLLSANPAALSTISLPGMVRGGVASGALAGFGYGEGAQDTAVKTVTGGAIGGLVSGALGAYANRLAPRGLDPELAAAAAAEDVRISGPMVGGRGQQKRINKAGVLESDAGTAPVVQQGFRDTATDIEAATGRLGRGGTVRPEAEAGGLVQTAGRRFIQRSKGVADRLYSRARSLAGDARFEPSQAIRQVDEELATLNANPETNAAEISFLEGLRNDLAAPGGKTIGELRDLRTSLRGSINEKGLTAPQAEARAARVLDATHTDARASLPAGAADAFRRADMYYRERMVHIDDVLDRFIGGERGVARLSGEDAFRKIKQMSNTDGRRLAAIMRDLTQDERLDVAATLAGSLGRNAADEPFQLAKFLAHTRQLSPSARRTIFGPDGAQSIDNLRNLTMRLQEATDQVNRSKTGRPVTNAIRQNARMLVAGLMSSGGAAATGSATGAAVGLAAAGTAMLARAGIRGMSARTLMSPRVSRWLAETANVNTARQAQEQVRRLGTIMAREPALTAELQPLQKWLNEAISSPAASETGGGQNEQ